MQDRYRKMQLKLCPSCNAYQDYDKIECPNCGHDLADVAPVGQKKKHKVNWPLRIGLYIGLFIFWIFALGFVENIKEPIKDGFMQQVRQGANIQQTAYNVSEFVFPFLLEVEARFWG